MSDPERGFGGDEILDEMGSWLYVVIALSLWFEHSQAQPLG